MAKKSAAQVKPVKMNQGTPQIPTPDEIFEEWMLVENVKIDAQIRQLDRVDTLVTLRSTAYEFYGEYPALGDMKDLMENLKEMFKEYKDILNKVSLDDLKDPEMADPFEDMIKPGSECTKWHEILTEFVRFQYLQPYASQLGQVHQKIVAAAEAHSEDE